MGNDMRMLWLSMSVLVLVSCVVGVTHASEVRNAARERSSSQRIDGYAISPDGKLLAEVVSEPDGGREQQMIVIRRLGDLREPTRLVYAVRDVTDVSWLNNRNIVFVRQEAQSEIVQLNIVSGKRSNILRSAHAMVVRGWDAKSRLLAVSYEVPWRWRGRVSVRMRDSQSTMDFIEPKWARGATTRVEVFRIGRDVHEQPVRVRIAMRRFVSAPVLAWQNHALIGLVGSESSYRTRVFNIGSGRQIDRQLPLFNLDLLAVSSDGQLAVTSTHLWRTRPRPIAGWGGPQNVYVVRKDGTVRRVTAFSRGHYLIAISGLWWGHNGELLAEMMGSKGVDGPDRWWLEEVNWKANRVVRVFHWPGGDLGGIGSRCEFDRERSVAICVAQTLTSPPELVEVDVRTGAMRVIARINPAQKPLKFSFVTLPIRNDFGDVSAAFLAVPPGVHRHPVPLAVMAYGFTEAYSKNAQWIASYPVARLVQSGIAVCMVNWAHVAGLRTDGFAAMKREMAGDISTLENAPSAVREHGIRVSRAIIMGWSFGGLFAAHVIEKDPHYVAAQVGDPAEWDVTGYALGNGLWRTMSKWGMGGPPVRQFIKNYVEMDPVGEGQPPHGPVLLEFVSRHPAVGQLIEEWHAVGADVEAFVYRHSVHWISVPAEARISRLRNLYWAKLNLLGPESVSRGALHSAGLTIPARAWWNARPLRRESDLRRARCRCQARRGPIIRLRGRQITERASQRR